MDLSLNNINELFPKGWSDEQVSKAKTIFFGQLALLAHKEYGGKIQIAPRVPLPGYNWFNAWYTPGISKISTTIRDSNETSFSLTSRGNMVAVVSDSTRVLGDGDCTPPGGLGVMEGKALLMKVLGGLDAVPLCIDSRGPDGRNDPKRIIEFVKMCQHSFGAINLEDISQPNCFEVLDVLKEECSIPVWHDDAQGTACVTLAGLLNALKLAGKRIEEARIVLLGAGASNTTIARLLIADGAAADRMIIFDSKGGLHAGRTDIENDKRYYRKWELCQATNPHRVTTIGEACAGADVLIALSTPGPNTVKPEWISSMAPKAIVFPCANPVPEIYPYLAKEAGAYIVATGRGDFPNQINNSLGFPGILKGTLLSRATKITDGMAIAAAHSLANFAEKRGINPNNIVPTMDDLEVFPIEAADVALQAVKEGVARRDVTWEQVYEATLNDIKSAQQMMAGLERDGLVSNPPEEMIHKAIRFAIDEVERL